MATAGRGSGRRRRETMRACEKKGAELARRANHAAAIALCPIASGAAAEAHYRPGTSADKHGLHFNECKELCCGPLRRKVVSACEQNRVQQQTGAVTQGQQLSTLLIVVATSAATAALATIAASAALAALAASAASASAAAAAATQCCGQRLTHPQRRPIPRKSVSTCRCTVAAFATCYTPALQQARVSGAVAQADFRACTCRKSFARPSAALARSSRCTNARVSGAMGSERMGHGARRDPLACALLTRLRASSSSTGAAALLVRQISTAQHQQHSCTYLERLLSRNSPSIRWCSRLQAHCNDCKCRTKLIGQIADRPAAIGARAKPASHARCPSMPPPSDCLLLNACLQRPLLPCRHPRAH